MTTPVVDHTLVFALIPSMTFEDSIKELYTRVANSTHLYKMTMQAMVVHLMAWEGVSATDRAIAAAAGAVYVPYTLAEYDVMIDRAANVAYIAGGAPPALNPFVENMADAAVHIGIRSNLKRNLERQFYHVVLGGSLTLTLILSIISFCSSVYLVYLLDYELYWLYLKS